MVTKEQAKASLITGVPLAVIIAILAGGVITPIDIQDVYYCQERDLAVSCNHLSSTTKTCYREGLPNMICYAGWKPIADFIPDQEIIKEIVKEPSFIQIEGSNLPCSKYAYKAVCRLGG